MNGGIVVAEPTELEREFEQSWKKIRARFADKIILYNQTHLKQVYELLRYCERQYGTLFRAGNSIYYLILSRSQHHVLRTEQARIHIDATTASESGKIIVRYYDADGGTQMILDQLVDHNRDIAPEILELFVRLLQHPID